MMKAMVLAVGLLLAATPAGAVTGLEFLQLRDNDQVSDEAAIMQPLVQQFLREGYSNVPDWGVLGVLTRALILKKGYRDKDVEEIAREAAIANGMSK
jgi:hypothetical protein